jgi:isopentenyl diphosphate isomerase/L-lactate dehydrogenase-like FMN-dependent dehydrogenase
MIGRPYLYGLSAAGEAGVELALAILRGEIDRTLALIGVPNVSDLDRSVLRIGSPSLPLQEEN